MSDQSNTSENLVDLQQRSATVESELAFYRDFYEGAPDMFASVDAATATILSCNQTLADKLGYTKDKIIGQPIPKLYHPDSETARQNVFKSFVETGVVNAVDLQLMRKDGRALDVSVSISAIRDTKGKIVQSRSIWNDMTQHDAFEGEDILHAKQTRSELDELKEIYDTAPAGLCVMDSDLRYIRINKWLADINGISPEDHIGRTFREIVPAIADSMEPVYQKVLDTGTPALDMLASGPTAADPTSIHHFLASYYPMFGDGNKVVGLRSIVRDVTVEFEAQRQLEGRERRLMSILGSTSDGIVTIDVAGSIEHVNVAVETLFGYKMDEVVGQPVTMLMPKPYSTEHDTYINAFINTGVAKVIGLGREVEGKRKDGSTFPMHLSVSTYEIDDAKFFVGTLHDISERKQAERELLDAKEVAEAANKGKSDFLSAMSHELRTPLNAILGFAELLEGEYYGDLNSKQMEYADKIGTSGKHLLDLISDLLDVSRIDVGSIHLDIQPLSIAALFDSVTSMIHGQLEEKHMVLKTTLDGDLAISGDSRRCRQIILNFLSNATKYSGEGSTIELSANTLSDDMVRIAVHDFGMGIAPENQKHVFDRFY